MNYSRICLNCKKKYEANRIDQDFCSIKCRNAANNEAYKILMAPYKKVADSARKQDDLLQKLWQEHKDIFIHADKLIHHKIQMENARQLHYGSAGQIIKAVFVKFELALSDKQLFKLTKLNKP